MKYIFCSLFSCDLCIPQLWYYQFYSVVSTLVTETKQDDQYPWRWLKNYRMNSKIKKKMVQCSFTHHKFCLWHLKMFSISLMVEYFVFLILFSPEDIPHSLYIGTYCGSCVCMLLLNTYLWKTGQLYDFCPHWKFSCIVQVKWETTGIVHLETWLWVGQHRV